jgi:hypothetical protein
VHFDNCLIVIKIFNTIPVGMDISSPHLISVTLLRRPATSIFNNVLNTLLLCLNQQKLATFFMASLTVVIKIYPSKCLTSNILHLLSDIASVTSVTSFLKFLYNKYIHLHPNVFLLRKFCILITLITQMYHIHLRYS